MGRERVSKAKQVTVHSYSVQAQQRGKGYTRASTAFQDSETVRFTSLAHILQLCKPIRGVEDDLLGDTHIKLSPGEWPLSALIIIYHIISSKRLMCFSGSFRYGI